MSTKNDTSLAPKGYIWVFGYGSLMWKPGFAFVEKSQALVQGYKRDLCILSHIFRGTPDRPGLVMGLCHGGTCQGMAFKIAQEHKEQVFAYLHKREMPNNVYRPAWLDVTLASQENVQAYSFISQPDHPQFVSHLSIEERLVFLKQGLGKGGSSIDYLKNTRAHLQNLGITDPILEAFYKRIE